jgi:hypothetical protein
VSTYSTEFDGSLISAIPREHPLKMISLNSLRKLVTIAALASSTIHAAEPESLDRTLEPYLKEFGLPALAAAVFNEGVVIASGVAGTRRAGQDEEKTRFGL